jgi:hypothetical protein
MERNRDVDDPFADVLATVRPAPPSLDRDRLLFDAGGARVRRELRRRATIAGAGLALAGLACLGGWWFERRRATDLERIVAELRGGPTQRRSEPAGPEASGFDGVADTLVSRRGSDEAIHSVRGWTGRWVGGDETASDPISGPGREPALNPAVTLPNGAARIQDSTLLRADAWRFNAPALGEL